MAVISLMWMARSSRRECNMFIQKWVSEKKWRFVKQLERLRKAQDE
ncbi:MULTISPECIES: hypothetical protein [Bacteroides]|uniref:Uncharacterized protein n=1 Tax=Bacteroides parvus TaxID=2763025 RepID=A0ABR7C2R0_9BACE|nr:MULTISPECIES: hypothetical protein [Bacteroides]MBC5591629.1 hypothetical protein [Bacteroides parvus]MBF7063429.1 hypothetical protein [Bacteroides sp. HF-5613]MBS6965647.1 hypothetical protein [Bacteroides sp.]MBT9921020.1 hypothetical protein [Bacteroides uniformis]MBV3829458.1 hypothetical protein [Bacteroides uniformis]